jgi:hypothetical protein
MPMVATPLAVTLAAVMLAAVTLAAVTLVAVMLAAVMLAAVTLAAVTVAVSPSAHPMQTVNSKTASQIRSGAHVSMPSENVCPHANR